MFVRFVHTALPKGLTSVKDYSAKEFQNLIVHNSAMISTTRP